MNTKRLAQTLLGTVQAWVEPAFKAVFDRIEALEQRPLPHAEKGEPGEPGKDADPALIIAEVERIVDLRVAALPKPKDGIPGKDAEPIHPDTLARMVGEEVRRQVDALPKPQDGRDAKIDLEWLERLITLQVQTRVDALPKPADGKDGEPGKDIDLETLRGIVQAEVAAMPVLPGDKGDPGQNATDEQVARVAEPMLLKLVAEIPRPKDGEPGAAGDPGKDADPAVAEAAAERAAAKLFGDFADELLRGLEEDVQPVSAPSLNVHVNAQPAQTLRSSAFNAREQTVIAKSVADTLRDVLMLPVKPVYDDKGRLLYGQRVAPEESI